MVNTKEKSIGIKIICMESNTKFRFNKMKKKKKKKSLFCVRLRNMSRVLNL